MGCAKCGAPTTNRLCKDCQLFERTDEDVENGKFGDVDVFADGNGEGDDFDTVAEIDVGDMIQVELEDGDTLRGDVYDVDVDQGDDEPAGYLVFFDGDDGEVYSVYASVGREEIDVARDAGVDRDGNVAYTTVGDVASIAVVDELDEYEPGGDWVDPFFFDRHTGELEDAGLSGREAEVVALKEQGLKHERIAERLELPTSTVDEYSRRARKKTVRARRLLDEIGEMYK